jgi:hypothetical protein
MGDSVLDSYEALAGDDHLLFQDWRASPERQRRRSDGGCR